MAKMGLIALIITFVVILLIVKTKRCTEFLFLGSAVAALVFYRADFVFKWVEILIEEVSSNTWLFLLCLLFGALTCLLKEARGTYGFANYVSKICKTEISCYLATLFLGLCIFIDDYINVLTIGSCMKNTYDKKRLPRQALAYLVDCTGTPVCAVVPISSWSAFYGAMFMQFACVSSLYSSPIKAYIALMPFLFYPIACLLIVLLFCIKIFPPIGKMKSFYLKYEDVPDKDNQMQDKSNALDFVLPMLLLIAVSIVSKEIIVGIISAIALCFVMYVPSNKMTIDRFLDIFFQGLVSMLKIVVLLTSAYVLKNITFKMGMTDFVVQVFRGVILKQFVPFICFAISVLLSFSTGVVWGTAAVAVPMLMPLVSALEAPLLPSMAAFVSGGIFGAQACVYSDTTVMSAEGCSVSNTDHAFSQMPYICLAAIIAGCGYIVCGFVL